MASSGKSIVHVVTAPPIAEVVVDKEDTRNDVNNSVLDSSTKDAVVVDANLSTNGKSITSRSKRRDSSDKDAIIESLKHQIAKERKEGRRFN